MQEPDLPQPRNSSSCGSIPAAVHPAQRARLTPLPIPAIRADNSANQVADFALSPDGTHLAVVSS